MLSLETATCSAVTGRRAMTTSYVGGALGSGSVRVPLLLFGMVFRNWAVTSVNRRQLSTLGRVPQVCLNTVTPEAFRKSLLKYHSPFACWAANRSVEGVVCVRPPALT